MPDSVLSTINSGIHTTNMYWAPAKYQAWFKMYEDKAVNKTDF